MHNLLPEKKCFTKQIHLYIYLNQIHQFTGSLNLTQMDIFYSYLITVDSLFYMSTNHQNIKSQTLS